MTSVYHSSSAEIPPTIIASSHSFSTLVETTVIKEMIYITIVILQSTPIQIMLIFLQHF
ncbi:hypothetical protein CsatA_007795 [Cannabis sativa]